MEDNKMYLNEKEIEEIKSKMGYSKIMVAKEKDGTPVYAVMWTKPKVPPIRKGGVFEIGTPLKLNEDETFSPVKYSDFKHIKIKQKPFISFEILAFLIMLVILFLMSK